MRFLGFEVSRTKAAVAAMSPENSSALMPSSGSGWFGGWFGSILESFTGAWQRNFEIAGQRDVMAFSAVYACISLIAGDISKLRPKLVVAKEDGTWPEVSDRDPKGSAFKPVLRKPNRYQTRIQFIAQWIASKLMYGNAYVLKSFDNRRIVNALYVLDPRLVTPRIAEDGAVFYTLKRDALSGLSDEITVPAEAIIHDTMITLWHPLVGVSPIFACGMSATQGIRIQQNSGKFFENMSRPSGILTAPGDITDAFADRAKRMWDSNFGGGKLGGTAVMGGGLKYEPMTIPAADSQLVEQLKWTIEDVARCFHVPLYMIGAGGQNPSYNNIGALWQAYYSQTLQVLIECIELLLDEGLGLVEAGYGCELDLEPLLRMDPQARADTAQKMIGAGILSPDEARLKENLPPVKGGETPYLQVQNYSLAALAERDADKPFSKPQAPAVLEDKPEKLPNASEAAKSEEEIISMLIESVELELA